MGPCHPREDLLLYTDNILSSTQNRRFIDLFAHSLKAISSSAEESERVRECVSLGSPSKKEGCEITDKPSLQGEGGPGHMLSLPTSASEIVCPADGCMS